MILKILSVPGEEGFTTSTNGDYKKVDPLETCPCDTTKACEKGCCCDKDCLYFMLNNDFFDDNFECNPESSSSRRIESKLEYCEDYKKSIDDLYNPLVLAFKILKRGFCLFRNNNKSKDEENKNSQEDETPKNEEDYNFKLDFIDVPLALPSGICLFGSYSIKEYQDYEVTCTYIYKNDINDIITKSIINNTKYSGENEEKYYLDQLCEGNSNCALKKMEIFDYGNESDINYYFETNNNNNKYQDFTFVIKHFENREDFHKSGNPGYIKGKPILIGTLEGTSNNGYISLFREGIIFPLELNQYLEEKYNFTYYDNYMDNKLTFEDLIFYQYQDNTTTYDNTIDNFNELKKLYFGMFGNANPKYINDWKDTPDLHLDKQKSLLLLGVYNDYGLVNNTQFKIQDFEIQSINNQETDKKNYFIMKFLKKNDTETDWWFAPGPGFIIRVPKNWMYPFQVGTTTYKTKS